MSKNLIAVSGKLGSGKDTVAQIIQFLTLDGRVFTKTNEDIVADIIVNNGHCASKSSWKINRFADKLKDIICLLIGCTREQLEDRDFKEKELGEAWDKYEVIYFDESGEYVKIFHTEEEMATFCLSIKPSKQIKDINILKMTPRLMMQLIGTEAGRSIIHENIWVNSLFSEYKKTPVEVDYGDFHNYDSSNTEYPKWIIPDMRFPNELKAVRHRKGLTIRVNRENNMSDKTNHKSETALDDATFDYVIDNNDTMDELINRVRQILITEKIIEC